MRGPLNAILEQVVEQLPGMVFVAVGMTLLAAGVLVPAWMSNQRLAQKHDTLQRQAALMTAQRERYVNFHDALAANDPQLLQRLAYSQFHVMPSSGDPWPGDPVLQVGYADDRMAMTASIDAALAEPATNIQPSKPLINPPTRLVRLASGTSRFGLLGAALCFVLGGLWYGGSKRLPQSPALID